MSRYLESSNAVSSSNCSSLADFRTSGAIKLALPRIFAPLGPKGHRAERRHKVGATRPKRLRVERRHKAGATGCESASSNWRFHSYALGLSMRKMIDVCRHFLDYRGFFESPCPETLFERLVTVDTAKESKTKLVIFNKEQIDSLQVQALSLSRFNSE